MYNILYEIKNGLVLNFELCFTSHKYKLWIVFSCLMWFGIMEYVIWKSHCLKLHLIGFEIWEVFLLLTLKYYGYYLLYSTFYMVHVTWITFAIYNLQVNLMPHVWCMYSYCIVNVWKIEASQYEFIFSINLLYSLHTLISFFSILSVPKDLGNWNRLLIFCL